ncbi:PIN domain-containing protein [Prosthecobacter sp.]|uniref:PIN domain-containing protein n=1 Tax=Prosthecobacter sp. TaxID=1965333 RepID=UPI003783294E
MTWYSDASFIVSAFGEDANSSKAKRWLRQCAAFPILISRLTLLEAETALRAATADGRLTNDKMQTALSGIHRAVLEGYLQRKDVPHHQWFPQSHRISMHASTGCVCRALDVLHVAAAVILKSSGFLTFDRHQRELAKAEGLEVAP